MSLLLRRDQSKDGKNFRDQSKDGKNFRDQKLKKFLKGLKQKIILFIGTKNIFNP